MDETHKKFIREEREAPENHHGGSFGLYMGHKIEKLQQQFRNRSSEVVAEGSGNSGRIFKGVTIHVNGYTRPTHQELKELMAQHGGVFENYYARSRVTHIICSNLPHTKLKQLRAERKPVPVVRPEWIVESIKANKLLHIQPFLLDADARAQRTLQAFTSRKQQDPPLADNPKKPTRIQQQDMGEKTLPNLDNGGFLHGINKGLHGIQELHGVEEGSHGIDEGLHGIQERLHGIQELHGVEELHGIDEHDAFGDDSDGGMDDASQADLDHFYYEGNVEDHRSDLGNVEDNESDSGNAEEGDVTDGVGGQTDWEEARRIAAEKRAACDVLKGGPQTSRDGEKFMETYFKASRLHFIGTWRTRFEALAENLSSTAPMPVRSKTSENCIIHLDMDCFFASVSALGNPAFNGKPLAVCHSNNDRGTAEVSSANYEARKFGIKAGMFISKAKQLCKDLIILPYEFEKYDETSEKVYRVLLEHSRCVQPISCDEAYMDITGLGQPEKLAKIIRAKIESQTGCTASCGIGPNLFLARLATKKAKPNGVFRIKAQEGKAFVSDMEVRGIPGVGWSLGKKLNAMGIEKVHQILEHTKQWLQKEFGAKTGEMLWNCAHARDDRIVSPPEARKSIGAEVNWGVRFSTMQDAENFLSQLSREVEKRMREAKVKGRCITLKVRRRRSGAPEPHKFLGCGICDHLSRSSTLSRFLSDSKDIFKVSWDIFKGLNVGPSEVRGLGITISKLDNASNSCKARTTHIVPSKVLAPPVLDAYDKKKPHPWLNSKDIVPAVANKNTLKRMFEDSNTRHNDQEDDLFSEFNQSKKRKMDQEGVNGNGIENNQGRDVSKPGPSKPPQENNAGMLQGDQIDPSVLAELPIHIRKEIEFQYKLPPFRTSLQNPRLNPKQQKPNQNPRQNPRQNPKQQNPRSKTFSGRKSNRSSKTTSQNTSKNTFKSGGNSKKRLLSNEVTKQPANLLFFGRVAKRNNKVGIVGPGGLTLSEVDPKVLAELPEDVQQEIVESLAVSTKELHVVGNDHLPAFDGLRSENWNKCGECAGGGDCYNEGDGTAKDSMGGAEKKLSDTEKLLEDLHAILVDLDLDKTPKTLTLDQNHDRLVDYFSELDPMAECTQKALRFLKQFGVENESYMETAMQVVETVQCKFEEVHGFRVDIRNFLYDVD